MRGRHEAHVHLQRLRAAEPLELALLQQPQQLHLHVRGDVADLVQEERAARAASSTRPGLRVAAPVKAPFS